MLDVKHDFDYDKDFFWQSDLNESCSIMGLEYSIWISALLVQKNSSYGLFSEI